MEQMSFDELGQLIRSAKVIGELRQLRKKFHDSEEFAPTTTLNILNQIHQINNLHDQLFIRCIELSEQRLKEEGGGAPPCPYAFVLFGSGGRSERTLWSDQDHGLIYECFDEAEDEQAALYFSRLSEDVMRHLLLLGYPPCKGNVACTNPQWRIPCSLWSSRVSQWVREPSWENARYLLLASDMRFLYGKASLFQFAKKQLMYLVLNEPGLIAALLKNTLHHKVMLNVFGQLLKERYGEAAGGIDIKYGAYIPLVSSVRLLSLQAELMENSTMGRLQGLGSSGLVSKLELAGWEQAFLVALKLRMRCLPVNGEFIQSNGKIPREYISKPLKEEIWFCLHKAKELQLFLKKNFPCGRN